MQILLDTSIIIQSLRLQYQLSADHEYFASDITLAELYAGKSIWESAKKKAILDEVVANLQCLPTSLQICQLAGQISATQRLGLPDALIAATAIKHKLPLATLNTKDFQRVKQLQLADPS